MSSGINSPCFGCQSRRVGCHSVCDAYIRNKEEREAKRNAILEKVTKERILNEYMAISAQRSMEKSGCRKSVKQIVRQI